MDDDAAVTEETRDGVSISPETKAERFVRVAERRTNAILKRIRILSNCSNRYAYEYDPEQVASVFRAIQDELERARARFERPTPSPFSLRGEGEAGGALGRVPKEV